MLVAAFSIDFWLGLIGVAVGVVAIFIALHEGKRQITKMEEVNQRQIEKAEDVRQELDTTLRRLQGEVATHYVGRFPDFMRDIVEAIEGAEEKLTIFCDLPAYGLVSNPQWFLKYTEAVQAKVRDEKVVVRMLHLDKRSRRAGLERQFGTSWDATSKSESVANFVLSRGKSVESQGEFFDLVEYEQEEALKRFKEAADKREMITSKTKAIMPMYFWIADDDRAIFALTQFDRRAHETGFSTRSENLIKAMHGIYDRYADEAESE